MIAAYRITIIFVLALHMLCFTATSKDVEVSLAESAHVPAWLDIPLTFQDAKALIGLPTAKVIGSVNDRITKIRVVIDGITTNEISRLELFSFQADDRPSENEGTSWFNVPLISNELLAIPGEHNWVIMAAMENGQEYEIYESKGWLGSGEWYTLSLRAELAKSILNAQLRSCEEATSAYSSAAQSLLEPDASGATLLLASFAPYLGKDTIRYRDGIAQLCIDADSALRQGDTPIVDRKRAVRSVVQIEKLAYNSTGISPASKVIRQQLLDYVGRVLDRVNLCLAREEAEIPGSTTKDNPSARIRELKAEQEALLNLYLDIQRILALTPGFSLEPMAGTNAQQP